MTRPIALAALLALAACGQHVTSTHVNSGGGSANPLANTEGAGGREAPNPPRVVFVSDCVPGERCGSPSSDRARDDRPRRAEPQRTSSPPGEGARLAEKYSQR